MLDWYIDFIVKIMWEQLDVQVGGFKDRLTGQREAAFRAEIKKIVSHFGTRFYLDCFAEQTLPEGVIIRSIVYLHRVCMALGKSYKIKEFDETPDPFANDNSREIIVPSLLLAAKLEDRRLFNSDWIIDRDLKQWTTQEKSSQIKNLNAWEAKFLSKYKDAKVTSEEWYLLIRYYYPKLDLILKYEKINCFLPRVPKQESFEVIRIILECLKNSVPVSADPILKFVVQAKNNAKINFSLDCSENSQSFLARFPNHQERIFADIEDEFIVLKKECQKIAKYAKFSRKNVSKAVAEYITLLREDYPDRHYDKFLLDCAQDQDFVNAFNKIEVEKVIAQDVEEEYQKFLMAVDNFVVDIKSELKTCFYNLSFVILKEIGDPAFNAESLWQDINLIINDIVEQHCKEYNPSLPRSNLNECLRFLSSKIDEALIVILQATLDHFSNVNLANLEKLIQKNLTIDFSKKVTPAIINKELVRLRSEFERPGSPSLLAYEIQGKSASNTPVSDQNESNTRERDNRLNSSDEISPLLHPQTRTDFFGKKKPIPKSSVEQSSDFCRCNMM